jgi:hypothetical protein
MWEIFWQKGYILSTKPLEMILQKRFSPASFVMNIFPTPQMKLKLGLQIGGRLLLANQEQDQSLWLAN